MAERGGSGFLPHPVRASVARRISPSARPIAPPAASPMPQPPLGGTGARRASVVSVGPRPSTTLAAGGVMDAALSQRHRLELLGQLESPRGRVGGRLLGPGGRRVPKEQPAAQLVVVAL